MFSPLRSAPADCAASRPIPDRSVGVKFIGTRSVAREIHKYLRTHVRAPQWSAHVFYSLTTRTLWEPSTPERTQSRNTFRYFAGIPAVDETKIEVSFGLWRRVMITLIVCKRTSIWAHQSTVNMRVVQFKGALFLEGVGGGRAVIFVNVVEASGGIC